jgi:hypothetical protein
MTAPLTQSPRQLVQPEGPAEHVRNALMILCAAEIDPSGHRVLTAEDSAAIRARLQQAYEQLEVR